MEEHSSAAMLTPKRLTGVASEVHLKESATPFESPELKTSHGQLLV